MKKRLLLLVLIGSLQLSAQTLTNRQVYDFLPGDIFQWEYTETINTTIHPCWLPSLTTVMIDSIVSKHYSTTMDTVFYEIHTVAYTPFQCDPRLPAIKTIKTETKYYTNLNDPAIHHTDWICMPVSDTVYSSKEYCGKYCWGRHSNFNLKYCFEEPSWSSLLIEGCGGPYVNSKGMDGQYTTRLVYYKKGGIPCWLYNPVGVSENEITTAAYLYPNPNNGIMNFQYSITNEPAGELIFYDVSGSLVLKYQLKQGVNNQLQINEQKLRNGVYFYKMIVGKETKNSGKVVIVK
jgi:hypothetical protein